MKFLTLLLFVSIACFSQQSDSLLYQQLSISNDTERVSQLYKSGFDLRNKNPELALQFANACEKEAKKSNSKKHIAKSYNLLGILFYKKGNYINALQYQKKSQNLNKEVKNDYGIALNLTNLGNIYCDLNSLDHAEQCYLQALQIYNKQNNTLQTARCLINIGVLKYEQKQPDAALHQFKEALTYAKELKDYDLMASCDNNIGTILEEKNQLDSALVYLEKALKLRDLIDNEIEMADIYNNLAKVFIKQKNFEHAGSCIVITDSICRKYEYLETQVELYDTRSLLYEAQGDFKQALFWTKKQYQLKDSLQKIEKADLNIDLLNEQQTKKPSAVTDTVNTKMMWMWILLLVMIIFITLFLMRYKR